MSIQYFAMLSSMELEDKNEETHTYKSNHNSGMISVYWFILKRRNHISPIRLK